MQFEFATNIRLLVLFCIICYSIAASAIHKIKVKLRVCIAQVSRNAFSLWNFLVVACSHTLRLMINTRNTIHYSHMLTLKSNSHLFI